MTPVALQRAAVLGAAALWLGQLALVLNGGANSLIAALPAVLVAGLALVPLQPGRVQRAPVALLALVVPTGALALALASISMSSLGVPLTAPSVLAALGVLVLAGALVAHRWPTTESANPPASLWAVAALLGALALATVLCLLVNHGLPPAGNDWAKYLLYADQIRDQHGLLIENPYWLGGVPFREDPGAPALYGSLLLLSGAPASMLGWDVIGLTLLSVLAVYGTCAALYGPRAAALAALFFAAIPATFDMNAWHGTANLFGLVILPLVLLGAGQLARGELGRREAAWLAAALVGCVAAHRLTGLIAVATVALVAAATLLRGRAAIAPLLRLGAGTAVIGALVAWDLKRRAQGDGGLQPYTAYNDTRVVWDIVLRDLTRPAVVLALAAVALVAVRWVRRREARDPALLLGAALGVVTLAYAYGWVVHFPGYYIRAAYFLPVAMGFGLAAAARVWDSRIATAIALGITVATGALAIGVVRDSARFYRFVDTPALRGLDYVAANAGPRDVIVTDRCYGFPSTWLLQRPTIAALEDADVGPAAELPFVREARSILAGGPAGEAAARRVGARFVLLSPNCPTADTHTLPSYLVPRYVSDRVAVFVIAQPSRKAK